MKLSVETELNWLRKAFINGIYDGRE